MATIKTKSMLEILQNKSEQIIIPIYQRNYDWKEENVVRLLSDLLEFRKQYEMDEDSIYFLGNMVYKKIGSLDDALTKMVLVDGQQRITTTLLILACIQNEQNVNASMYLNVDENGEQKLKIAKLNNATALSKIINNKKLTQDEQNTNYYKNYVAIKKWLSETESKGTTIRNLLEKTVISWVQLSSSENENKVFETINSTGQPLKSSDLIKNYLFFGALAFSANQEEELQNTYVEKIEKMFLDSDDMDDFYRYYVSIRGGFELAKQSSRDIYKSFVKMIEENGTNLSDYIETKALIQDILKSALIYNEANKEISQSIKTNDDARNIFFRDVFKSNKGTYFGMLYAMVDYWFDIDGFDEPKLIQGIDSPSLNDIFKTTAKYIIYRAISGKKDKNISRDVMRFFSQYKNQAMAQKEEISLEGFFKFMQEKDAEEQSVPTDDKLLEYIETLDAYKLSKKKTKNILIASELGAQTTTPFSFFDIDWQIEHIMPQEWATFWSKDMGIDEVSKYIKGIHALPNLTLLTTKLNPAIGNREWSFKKEKVLEDSRLQIDKIMNNHEKYCDEFLAERATAIRDNIVNLFK